MSHLKLFVCLAIVSIAAHSADASEKDSSPVRLGVVGMTHGHVNGIFRAEKQENFEIVGIVEPNKELAKRHSEEHGFDMSIVFDTMDEMLDATQPEGVTAFGSILEHLDVVRKAAPRGIHVMVEKPLAFSFEHALEMQDLATEHGIHVLTNYVTTWYPTNHKAREIVASGKVGPIRKIVVHDGHKGPKNIGVSPEFLEWLIDPEQNGGGAIIDFGCYGANLMTWLMSGEDPISVTAVTQQLQPESNPLVDDEATIIVTYPSAQGIIQASWNWPISRKDMEIYGLTGAVFADDRNQLRVRIPTSNREYDEETYSLAEHEAPWHDPFAMFSAVIRGEVELLRGDLSSLENNVVVVRILDAARESARTGKTVRLR